MVVTNLVVVGVMVVLVVEMEVVLVVFASPRVDRSVGDVQQGEQRLHQPQHQLLHPTPEPLVQLGELLGGFSCLPTMHCSSPTPNTPILISRPSHGTHSETKDSRSRFLCSAAATRGLGLETDTRYYTISVDSADKNNNKTKLVKWSAPERKGG